MTLNLAEAPKLKEADRNVVQILRECLELETSAEKEAAKRIDEYHRPAETQHDSDDEDEPNLYSIWDTFVCVSFHIPHDHPAQNRLVQILLELRDLPSRKVEYASEEFEFWSDMPLFREYLTEAWESIGPLDGLIGREGKSVEEMTDDDSSEWRNFISFSARLWNANLINLFRQSVYTIRDALENSDPGDLELKWHVAAASEWIIHCGPLILQEFRGNDMSFAGTPYKGDLYDGKGKTETYRWEFWKRRFEEVGEKLDGDFKSLALECADRIQQLSQGSFD